MHIYTIKKEIRAIPYPENQKEVAKRDEKAYLAVEAVFQEKLERIEKERDEAELRRVLTSIELQTTRIQARKAMNILKKLLDKKTIN